MILIISAVLAAIGIVAFFVLAWWGLPFLAIAGVLALIHVTASRQSEGPNAGAIERGRRQEPTGMPRKATGDAETANERVGQR